jgi:hypothetical protein
MSGMIFSPWILFFSLLFGLSTAWFAHNRGRNPYLWFSLGFLFGLLGVLAFFFPLTSQRKSREVVPEIPQPYIEGPRDAFWYYLDEERQQKGPMSFDAFSRIWRRGEMPPTTLVWHEQLEEWKPLQELIVYTPST